MISILKGLQKPNFSIGSHPVVQQHDVEDIVPKMVIIKKVSCSNDEDKHDNIPVPLKNKEVLISSNESNVSS